MKITIVTVCYNAEKTIRKTIESIINQTYENIQYLIIDGCSTDDTLSIVKEYSDDKRITIISERDTGLYNAMNKAIKIADGEYINFMNSGDAFADSCVLEDIVPFLDRDVVYGDVIRLYADKSIYERYYSNICTFFLLGIGRMMSHQSIFTRTMILKEKGFDENYTICADYEFVTRSVKEKKTFRYIKRLVAETSCVGGISQLPDNIETMRAQDDKCLKQHIPILFYLTRIPRRIIRLVGR